MRFYLPTFSIILSLASLAQTIPSQRIHDWSTAGFQGNSPEDIISINIVSIGAANDSSTAADAFIQQAIDSLNGRFGIIYFPAGIYLINSSINLPDSVVLKGAGSDSTTLIFDFGGAPSNCINISKSQSEVLDPFTKIISGYQRSSSLLTVADASGFNENDYAEIRQNNGSWDTQPASYAEQCVGQMVKIKSVSGNTLEIEPVLRIDFDTLLNVEIRKIRPVANAGVECLKMIRGDSSASPSVYNIHFDFAVNCRVNGVESAKSMGAHVLIQYSKNITVAGSYFHHSFGYDGSGTRGYGVCLRQHASDCLIENNIFQFLRHAMMTKEGANGNVFAYNYSREPNRSEPIPDFSGDISIHGHYSFANLFEGNIVQNIIIDHFWGQSGPYNTFFRNRAELYGILITGNSPFTSNQNFVGNEVTNTAPLLGSYILMGAGHFEHSNNIKGNITPAGTDTLPESSLYLSSKPEFWDSTAWPSIGIPVSPGSGSNPAQQRFLNTEPLTVCEIQHDSIPDTTGTYVHNIYEALQIQIFPNPSTNYLNIVVQSELSQPCELSIADIFGRQLLTEKFQIHNGENSKRLFFPYNMQNGVYLIHLKINDNLFRFKIFKTNY